MPQHPCLADQVATRLAAALEDPGFVPGPIGAMAKRWQVSYTTMAQAVQRLVALGRLEVQPGRAPRRAGRPELTGQSTVGEAMRACIAAGEWRCGEPLPKVTALAARFGCGRSQIATACRMLEVEQLLHRHGRAWQVGPAPLRKRDPSAVPTVLLIGEEDRFWRYQLTSSMAAFFQRCTAELDAAGCRLHFVGLKQTEAIRAICRRSGYLGAVVLAEADESHLIALHRRLTASGRPAIHFDNGDRHPAIASLVSGSVRFTLDEAQAMATVIDILVQLGHRRIGVPVPDHAWCRRRVNCLQSAAARHPQRPELRITDLVEGFWAGDYSSEAFRSPRDFVADIAGSRAVVGPAQARALVRRHCRSLLSLVETGVSVVLGVNDHYAREYQMALDFAGIAVPAACGLLGIDNHVQTALFGLSTIDTGFDRLGYLAAHRLIGDLPQTAGCHQIVASQVRFIDRGSLARR